MTEQEKHKCSDCGKEDEQTWFEKAKDYDKNSPRFIQHGISFVQCQQCDGWICEDCELDHAQFETYG